MKQKILTFSPLTEKELRKFIPEESAKDLYNRGYQYKKNNDYQKAFYWYEKAAEQGHTEAQHAVGWLYENGKGVERNYEKAVYWYQKAAEQGLARSMYGIGNCYYNGKKDYKKAFYWYQKAAEHGLQEALYFLAVCYEYGLGTDWITALKWYVQAAEQGNELAKKKLESLQK